MNRLIYPPNMSGKVKAFFTGKDPGDDFEAVSLIAGISSEDIYMPIQKHTDKIVIEESSRESKIADSVITREKGLLIGVRAADCVPVLVHDQGKSVVAAVHAGWRGTAAGIVRKTLQMMMERYYSSPADILLAIGPSIGRCCYCVDHDVVEEVRKATGEGEYVIESGGRYFLDLPAANRYQAISSGVPVENIWVSSECTYCNPDRFFSYRYSKGTTGRQAGFIGLV